MGELPVALVYWPAAVLLVGVAWVVFRVFVRRDYTRRGRLTVVSAALETAVCALYAYFPAIYWPNAWWPEVNVHPILEVLGYILVVGGMALGLGTLAWFGLRRALGLQSDELVQGGFYRYSRNPQIVFFFTAMVGVVVLWPSWYALGWLALYWPVFHPMVISEEEHLRAQFGEAYEAYCARTRRYLGL